LTEVLTPIQHRFESFGVQLEVDLGVIDGIKRSNDDDDVKLKNILTKWMEACDPPVTWGTIIDIVGRDPIKNKSLKEAILKFLINHSDKELDGGPQPTPTTRITQRPHLRSSSSSQYSTRSPLSEVQNREPRSQVSSSASTITCSPYHHKTTAVQFIIMPKPSSVFRCFGCEDIISEYDMLVVQHKDRREFIRRGRKFRQRYRSNVYYHLQMPCIVKRHRRSNLPPFVVSEEAKSIIPTLTPDEYREFLKFNVT
jgi:hypothetical protein